MKLMLRISVFVFLAVVLSSCRKVVVVPQNPIVGSWVISDAAESNGYGWSSISTGLDNGVFNFYNNGIAEYDDGNELLHGSWYVKTSGGGYYDEYGHYYNDTHQTLEIHLADNYNHGVVDLYFDDVSFYGNHFTATYYDRGYVVRYGFGAY